MILAGLVEIYAIGAQFYYFREWYFDFLYALRSLALRLMSTQDLFEIYYSFLLVKTNYLVSK